jgi:large subunit ribosomal protein L28
VSHSKHHTKRSFDVNLFSKKFYWVEENCWIRLKISAAGLRMINKVGLDAAIRQAIEKGYLNWNDLEKGFLAWGNVENNN